MVYVLDLVFCFLCCLLRSKQWSCIVLCLCCLLSLFSGLHLVVLFLSCCFVFKFCYFVPFKEKTKNQTQQKSPKEKMQKKGQNQLAQLCSQIAFLIFWGGLQNGNFCWKPYKIVVSAYFEKKEKCAKNVNKVESKICPRLSQKSVQVCCAT